MPNRFPLSSEQLNLLMSFEAAGGSLVRLADTVRRDASVVSRNLQRLAEDAPVLEKSAGKWRLTPAGRRVNELSRQFLGALGGALGGAVDAAEARRALVIINAQQALCDPARTDRSNPGAEANLARLLAFWRRARRPLVHVKHVSPRAESPFHPSKATAAFLAGLEPHGGEWVVEKPGASAFSAGHFAADLRDRGIEALVLAGFTANECVDATAKQARDLGFAVEVVGDATAMFDVVGPDGRVFPSERTQDALLASLHAGGAAVIGTDDLINGKIRN